MRKQKRKSDEEEKESAWAELRAVYDDEVQAEDVLDQVEKLLANPEHRHEEDKHLSESQYKKQLTALQKENKEIIEQCKLKKQRLEPLFKKEDGYDIKKMRLACNILAAKEARDEDWVRECDRYLEGQPIGASGWSGINEDEEDEEIEIIANDKPFPGTEKPFPEDEKLAAAAKVTYYNENDEVTDVNNMGMPISLKDHQDEAVQKMWDTMKEKQKKGFMLCHSMGLGKTLTILAYINRVCAEDKKTHCLVLCSKTLQYTWYEECEKWQLGFQYHSPVAKQCDVVKWQAKGGLCIMTYGLFRLHWEDWNIQDVDYLIVDEAHSVLGNNKTLFYKAFKQCADRISGNGTSAKRIFATGTPLQNSLMEYFWLMQLINPDLFKSDDARNENAKYFKQSFANPINKGMLTDAKDSVVSDARIKLKTIQLIMKDYVDRKDGSILESTLPLKMEYKCVFRAELPKPDTCVFSWMSATHQSTMAQRVRASLALINEILNTTNEKILVFSTCIALLNEMNEKSPGLKMTGEMTKSCERQELVNCFQTDANMRVFYISTPTGCCGLTLTAASRILILDPSWNPVQDLQACFRAYRYGQTKPVFIYRLVATGKNNKSIEEKIYLVQVQKNKAASKIIDDQDVKRVFTAAELKSTESYEEEELKKIPDAVLRNVKNNFCSISSHSKLFNETNNDAINDVTTAEEQRAKNEHNRMLLKRDTRFVQMPNGSTREIDVAQHFYPETRNLIKPMTPAFILGCKQGVEVELMHAYNKYELQFQSVKTDGSTVDYDMVTLDRKYKSEFKLPRTHDLRVKCKGIFNGEKSDWSEWSALLPMRDDEEESDSEENDSDDDEEEENSDNDSEENGSDDDEEKENGDDSSDSDDDQEHSDRDNSEESEEEDEDSESGDSDEN